MKKLFLLTSLLLICVNAEATIIYVETFEDETCDQAIADNSSHGVPTARNWDIQATGVGAQAPFVRCSGAVSGSRYMEQHVLANQADAAIEIQWPSPISLSIGTTYYMGALVYFEQIGGADIWAENPNADSYDKWLDFGRQDVNMRWVIGTGWGNGEYANNAIDHQWSVDPWCILGSSICDTGWNSYPGGDTRPANVSPWSKTNPRGNVYGKWVAIVLEVTMQSGATGVLKLYVDGVNSHNFTSVQTSAASPELNRIWVNSTIAQPSYNTTEHKRRVDCIIMTDTLSDIQAGGSCGISLLADPETASGGSSLGHIHGGGRIPGRRR